MKLLVTGGTGFLGRSLLDHAINCSVFHARPSQITVLSRNPQRFLAMYPRYTQHTWLKVRYADVLVPESLPKDESFTHVIHAAAEAALSGKIAHLSQFIQIIEGTKNILDLAVASGAHRFLLTSSGAVYGPQPPDLAAIPEDWPSSPPLSEPSTAYGQAKRAAEHLCAIYSEEYGLETVIARCFSFVGPYLPLNVHFAIGNFIRDALIADFITVCGDGTPLRTYLDQTDLAHWLFIMLRQGHPNEAYNVGSDVVISISELACLVRDLLSPSKPVHILGGAGLSTPRHRYVPDICKAYSHLALTVKVALSDSILRCGECIRDQVL